MAKLAKSCHSGQPVGMTTMNISLPDDMKAFVDEQVRARGYMSSSEYIRDLIRKQKDIEDFRAMIQEGIDSGPAEEADSVSRRLWEKVRTAE